MNVQLVKDLAVHGMNTVKILNDILLGLNEVRPYISTSTYNIDFLIIHFNSTTNKFELLRCKENGITGVYDDTKWEVFNPLLTNGAIDCGEF